MRGFAGVMLAAGAVALGYGCSSSGDDTTYSFKDEAGRQCTVKRVPPKAACDQPPSKTCSGGNTPCFILSTGQLELEDGGVGGPRLVRNCASCCNDSDHSSSSMTADCIALVCKSDSECAGEPATCIDGYCQAR